MAISASREVYQIPLHRPPTLASVTTADPDAYPEAEDFCGRRVCLPLWRSIHPGDVEVVGDYLADHLQPAEFAS